MTEPTVERSLSGELLTLAASMVRLEGGCESGHKAGQWHMHEEPYHAKGRYLAGLVQEPSPELERLRRIEAAARVLATWDDDVPTGMLFRWDALRAALEDETHD